jgi:hypothetical protein
VKANPDAASANHGLALAKSFKESYRSLALWVL